MEPTTIHKSITVLFHAKEGNGQMHIPESARLMSPNRTLVQTPRCSLCREALIDASSNALHADDIKRMGKQV